MPYVVTGPEGSDASKVESAVGSGVGVGPGERERSCRVVQYIALGGITKQNTRA